MAGLVNTIGGGLKRAFDTWVGNESDTKDDAQPSERTRAKSIHDIIPTSPEHQPRTKRPRTQLATEQRQVASPRHPEEKPRSRQPHTQFSAYERQVASPTDRPEEQPRARQSHTQPSGGQERGASPTEFLSRHRGKYQRTPVSADERRLFSGIYPSTEDSTPIHVPQDEWGFSSNMKRKPASGSNFRPANTLRRPGPGANTLATFSSRGVNVSGNPAKRQKTNEVYSQRLDEPAEEEYLSPETQEQSSATLGRQPSIISVNSQSQDTPSQRANMFQHNESRNVHGVLNGKRKGRKPKPGATQPGSPQDGTRTAPVSVDDNEDFHILNEQPLPSRSAYQTAVQRTPRVEVDSDPTENTSARQFRNHASPAVHILDRMDIPRRRSPGLGETFVRDDEESGHPPATYRAQSKIRDKMQSTSNTARVIQPQQVVDELSEDELACGPTVQSSARKAWHTAIQRSPSPNHITSTHFTKGRKRAEAREATTIPLSSLRLTAGNWKTLFLLYSWEHKAIHFLKNDKVLHYQGVKIQLGSKHAQTVFCNTERSTAVILVGAKDRISSGRIWFDFKTTDDRDDFLEAIDHMNPRAHVRDLEAEKFAHVCESAESFFTPAPETTNPELQAMDNRRVTISERPTDRERTLAAQRGLSLPDPASQMPKPRLTRAMRPDYVNQPGTKAAQDRSSPPPVSGLEQAAPTRSSRRLQSKDRSKVAQPAEPEFERWTEIHGIPEWEAPLTYPVVGTSRTTIDAKDIARLDDGELLNDNIISFCLREMQENNPELKDKVHIFNSFFYTSLTTAPSGKRVFNYESVKRWTRQIDLFSHPYVAVPINTQFHWFLVIICNLDKLERKLNLDGLGDEEEEPEAEPQPSIQEPLQSRSTEQNDIEIPESPQEAKDGDISQGVKRISLDASQEQEGELPPLSKLKPAPRKGRKQGPPAQKMDSSTPVLILLDSLSGTHPQEIKNLKQYVVHEGRDKRALEFDYTELKGLTARGLPQQTNLCDCGVYLIGYMEAFLRDPAEFVRKVMSRELDYNNEFTNFDPSKKRAEIRERLIKLEEEQSFAKKQRKKEKSRLLKMANKDSGSLSPALAPTQMSSPIKPPAAHTDSRMVQSSPTKPPPQPMHEPSTHKPSPPKESPHKLSPYKLSPRRPSPYRPSSSRRSLPIVERSAQDEMLFGDADEDSHQIPEVTESGTHDNYTHLQEDISGHSHDQSSTIRYERNFANELHEAAQFASQVD